MLSVLSYVISFNLLLEIMEQKLRYVKYARLHSQYKVQLAFKSNLFHACFRFFKSFLHPGDGGAEKNITTPETVSVSR